MDMCVSVISIEIPKLEKSRLIVHMCYQGGWWGEASQVVQLVRNPPAMQEIPVQLLGWEDPLEKG